ncbi:MAG: membrane protein insertase YidC [Deltaproteobacteria bacterium]|nr:membrane protein insertase YidC [Deltaproteobacteria bacterium]
MEKKTILAIVLSVLVVFMYQFFFAPKPDPVGDRVEPAAVEEPQEPAASPDTVPLQTTRPVTSDKNTVAATVVKPGIAKEIVVDTPLYRAVFTTRGATLETFQLKHFKKKLDSESELIELVNSTPDMPLPLSLSFVDSSLLVDSGDFYEVDRESVTLGQNDQETTLTFTQTYPGSVKIEKIFTFHPDDYVIQMDVKLHNLSPATLQQNAMLTWYHYDDPVIERDRYTHNGPVYLMGKSVKTADSRELKIDEHHGPDISWSGYESKYFIAAMISQKPALTSLILNRNARNVVSVQLKGPKNIIPAGQNALFAYTLYLGPKDYSIMKSLNVGLENAIDFGSLIKWLSMPLLIVLKFIFQYVHNYGIAIIILTIFIKIIFWPLGNKSYKSMKEMQKLQPKMQELRAKYKDDKQKLSQETMAL